MKQILNWFRRRELESDLDRELKYHVDRRVSDLIRSGLLRGRLVKALPAQEGIGWPSIYEFAEARGETRVADRRRKFG